eukprot:scaffold18737_cov117-Skeletonema_dohrnii-CCMP3373.AAC.5
MDEKHGAVVRTAGAFFVLHANLEKVQEKQNRDRQMEAQRSALAQPDLDGQTIEVEKIEIASQFRQTMTAADLARSKTYHITAKTQPRRNSSLAITYKATN